MFFRIFKAEWRKYFLEMKTYYPDHLVSMIITFIIFAVFLMLGRGEYSYDFYLGFVYWYLMSSLISEASVSISTEKQLGTLEQLLIKPIPFEVLLSIKTLVWYSLNFIKVCILMVILSLVLRIPLDFHWGLLPIFIISSIGIYGFTLVLVSLTLRYTKTASFESIISYALLFLTGAVIPLDNLPSWVEVLGHFLPLSLGLELSQTLLKTGSVSISNILLLLVQSFVFVGVGYVCFRLIYRNSRKNGLDRSY